MLRKYTVKSGNKSEVYQGFNLVTGEAPEVLAVVFVEGSLAFQTRSRSVQRRTEKRERDTLTGKAFDGT